MRRALGCALVILSVAAAGSSGAQETAVRRLVDCPTAEILERGSYAFNTVVYPEGGALVGIGIGLLHNLSVGFTYGGLEVIGSGEPDWNPRVEFQARLKLIEESFALPAIALGFDSQGFGRYFEEYPDKRAEPDPDLRAPVERYQVKSKGFYAVGSKHYAFLGTLGLHGGINYSLENDDDEALNFFFGVEKSLSPEMSLLAEYDMAINDNEDNEAFGEGFGYLNIGLSWIFAERLRIEVDLRNLLENSEGYFKEVGQWSRGIQIEYLEFF